MSGVHRSKATKTETKSASATTSAPARSQPKSALKMSDRPALTKAVDNFIRDHSGFESSVAHATILKDVENCTTLNEVFLVPLQHKIINMDSALKFVLFLRLVTVKPVEESEPDFPSAAKFSTESALDALAACYDLGVKDSIWAHVDEALGGEEEGDEAEQ